MIAAQPTVTKGQSYHFDVDPAKNRLIYTSGRAVYLRDISHPGVSLAFTEHTVSTTVARFASGHGDLIASGDIHGNIRLWNPSKLEQNSGFSGPLTKYQAGVLQGSILDISWDSEGQRVLAVGEGREKFGHAFNAETGSSIGEISGHSRRINACSIRPFAKPIRAVTASDDVSVAFYHGLPFKYQFAIRQHVKMVQDVRYSPMGKFFASTGTDGNIFLHDGVTGNPVSLSASPSKWIKGMECGHSSGVLGVAWSPLHSSNSDSSDHDSHQFATCSSDGTVKIWDIETNQLSQTFIPSTPQVGCVWASHDPNLIISVGAPDGTFYYMDIRAGQVPIKEIHGHTKAITVLHCPPNQEDTFYTGSYDGKLYAWSNSMLERQGGTPIKSFASKDDLESSQIVSIVSSSDNLLVSSIGQDDQIRNIDPEQPSIYTTMSTKSSSRILSDNSSTATLSKKTPVTMLSLAAGIDAPSARMTLVLYDTYLELRQSSSKTEDQISSSLDIIVQDHISIGGDSLGRTATCMAIHPGMKESSRVCIAVGCMYNGINTGGTMSNPLILLFEYDPITMTLHNRIIENPSFGGKSKGHVLCVSYSPDGSWLAVCDTSRQVLLYDSATMQVDNFTSKWINHSGKIQCIAWHPASSILATGSLDTSIIIWKVGKPAGDRKTIPRAHQDGVNSIAFINAKTLVSCGQDGCLRKWDVES